MTAQFVAGQNPQIVKAVSGTVTYPADVNYSNWQGNEWNGFFFYQGTGSPTKLCVTDGTDAGTKYLRDLGSGSIAQMFAAQDFMYVICHITPPPGMGVIATEIWRTDGTAAGTSLVYTMPPSTSYTNVSTFYSNSIVRKNYSISGNVMYFSGYTPVTTGSELWRTDGTAAGTYIVKDIKPGVGNSNPSSFCKIGNDVFFFAQQTGFERKLWKTDGTEAGTVQVPVAEPFIANTYEVGFLNNKMIFFGSEDYTNNEPWVSDGTPAGTFKLAEIRTGTSGSYPTVLQGMNLATTSHHCFFVANKGSNHNLWSTDGTVAGTVQLTPDALNTQTYNSTAAFEVTAKTLFFTSGTNSIYKSDGTVGGTNLIRSDLYYPTNMKMYKNAAFLSTSSNVGNPNIEMWRSDGLPQNTQQAFDLLPGTSFGYPIGTSPFGLFVKNNKLYFFGSQTGARNLYCYTGDFTFNGSRAGGLWSDSSNWNSGMPPGITDTVFINSGTPNALNVTGAKAYTGLLQLGNNAVINLQNTTDSIFVNNKLIVTTVANVTGAGALVLKNAAGQTVDVDAGAVALNNLTVASDATLSSGNISISNGLALRTGMLSLGAGNISIDDGASTATGNANSFIVTNGTGRMSYQNLGATGRTGSVLFPLGVNGLYSPISFSNAGTSDNFSAALIPKVFGSYMGDNPGTQYYSAGAVNNTWFVSEEIPGGSDATISVQWDQSQELPAFDRSQAFISHYTLGAWDQSTPMAAIGANPYSVTRNNISSFSPFSVQNINAILPLRFVSINAKNVAGKNTVNWVMAEAIPAVQFDVMKSADGIHFEKIKTVFENLSSPSVKTYSFVDPSQTASKSYYKIIARSGATVVQSEVRLIQYEIEDAAILLFPNPASTSTNVLLPASAVGKDVVIQIFDSKLSTIFLKNIRSVLSQKILMDLTSLSKGVYFVRVIINADVSVTKLIVQ